MKQRLFIVYVLCSMLFVNNALSQNSQKQATDVFQTAINKIKSSGGIEAGFTVALLNNGIESEPTEGVIQLKNNRFKITMPSITVWFNGKTQWTMQAGSDEVNVSNPTPEELRTINPYALIDIYRNNYTCTHKSTNYQGKTCHEITLKAKGKEKMQEVVFDIDTKTNMVLRAKVKQNGQWICFKIRTFKDHQNWNDQHFTFPTKEYPNVEVIDLR